MKKSNPLCTWKVWYQRTEKEEDVASRIKKANGVFVQLYPMWRNHNISKRVKIWIFNTNITSVLLYACETWKTPNQITRRLQIFVNKFLKTNNEYKMG